MKNAANPTPAATVAAANDALFTTGQFDAVGEFFAADYRVHLTGEDLTLDHEGIRKTLALYRSAFPDLQVEIQVLVANGDRVAWQRTFRGTHDGAFRGFPASGRSIVWREMITSRLRDGRIAEEWLLSDLAEQLLLARKR